MNNYQQVLDNILTEWAKDVPNGMPDKTNSYHLVILDRVMNKYINNDIKKSLLQNIRNEYPTPDKDYIKENFVECGLQLIELGRLISEARINQSKYPDGARFMYAKTGKDGFNKYIIPGKKVPSDNTVFVKTKKTNNAIDVIQKQGGVEIWLKVEGGKEVYHLVGTESTLGGWFKRAAKNAGDINFDTSTLETCALLGMKMDGKTWLSKFNSATDETIPGIVTDFIGDVNSTLSGGDWTTHNLGSMKTASLANIKLIAALSAGMTKFTKDKGIGSWNFVHNQIDTYYKAEEKNPHVQTVGGKANTADCIVVDSSVNSFLKNMETADVTFDSSGLCTLSTGEKFYQVSLKKEEAGAKLGKITSDFA